MNHTEAIVLKTLTERQRVNKKTNLTHLFQSLKRDNEVLNRDEFYSFFKDLQDRGLGVMIKGRRDNPDRFIWNYNLKEVAQKVLGVSDKITPHIPVKKKLGRPFGSKNKMKALPVPTVTNPVKKAKSVSFKLIVDPSNVKDVEALLQLVNEISKK